MGYSWQSQKRTQLFSNRLELIQICLVLGLILHLLLDALQNPDRGGVVVHAARRTERRLDDGGRGHEVVREAVVQPALDLEEVLRRLEKVHVALRERLERLLVMCV